MSAASETVRDTAARITAGGLDLADTAGDDEIRRAAVEFFLGDAAEGQPAAWYRAAFDSFATAADLRLALWHKAAREDAAAAQRAAAAAAERSAALHTSMGLADNGEPFTPRPVVRP